MSWEPTHYFLDDGSVVRFITDDPPATPGYFIVENEDGEAFQTLADELAELE